MNAKHKNYIKFGFLFFLTACSSPKPSESDLISYVNLHSDNGLYAITDIDYSNYPNRTGESGKGRSNFKGTFSLSEDLYSVDNQAVIDALKQRGFTLSELTQKEKYLGRFSDIKILKKVASVGDKVAFSGEVEYLAKVDGFEFSGGVDFLRINGSVRSQYEQMAVVVGSDHFREILDSAVAARDRVRSAPKAKDLEKLASLALRQGRLIESKGNNALEYYDQILTLNPYDSVAYQGRKLVAEALRKRVQDSMLNSQFKSARKYFEVLKNLEPLHIDNDQIEEQLVQHGS